LVLFSRGDIRDLLVDESVTAPRVARGGRGDYPE
jgi:hypothetical protein